jgi:response regulator RpfG family c-di-GMP phosphodiesterase
MGMSRFEQVKDERYDERCGQTSLRVADNLGLPEVAQRDAYYAGLFHRIAAAPSGGLTPAVRLGTQCEPFREQHARCAQQARELLGLIDGLNRAADSVAHMHEWLDGSGAPAGLRGERVPPGAAVVGSSVLFHELVETALHGRLRTPDEALVEIRALAGRRFSAEVVQALQRARGAAAKGPGAEDVVGVHNLVPGMVLARDLYHPDGRLLLSEGLVLTRSNIDKLANYGHSSAPGLSLVVRRTASS